MTPCLLECLSIDLHLRRAGLLAFAWALAIVSGGCSSEHAQSAARDAARVQVLDYIASCALSHGVRILRSVAGRERTLRGEHGLAPHWPDVPLDLHQRRLVSACVLARTNRLGQSVAIELHDAATVFERGVAALRADERFEGGYFGDIFADPPLHYACSGNAGESAQAPGRDCATPDITAPGRSRCGFRFVGPCDRRAFEHAEGDYLDTALMVVVRASPPGIPSSDRHAIHGRAHAASVREPSSTTSGESP